MSFPLIKGDRIELVSMPHDPCPIEPGTKGTVDSVHRIIVEPSFIQIWVNWDNGRSLAMCCPPDEYKKL